MYFYYFISVFADGRVCISILHAPGDDPLGKYINSICKGKTNISNSILGYELSAERWSPVQSVEKILLSVVSMLAGIVYSRCVD